MADLDYCDLFRRLPYAIEIIDSDLVAREATEEYLRVTMRTREQLVGKAVFEVFPPSEDDVPAYQALRRSFEMVLTERIVHRLPPIEYAVCSENGEEIRHWQVVNAPLTDAHGNRYIINAVVDLTEAVQREEARHALARSLARTLAGISNAASGLQNALEASMTLPGLAGRVIGGQSTFDP